MFKPGTAYYLSRCRIYYSNRPHDLCDNSRLPHCGRELDNGDISAQHVRTPATAGCVVPADEPAPRSRVTRVGSLRHVPTLHIWICTHSCYADDVPSIMGSRARYIDELPGIARTPSFCITILLHRRTECCSHSYMGIQILVFLHDSV